MLQSLKRKKKKRVTGAYLQKYILNNDYIMHTKSVPLGDKEQPGDKELFTDYQLFHSGARTGGGGGQGGDSGPKLWPVNKPLFRRGGRHVPLYFP